MGRRTRAGIGIVALVLAACGGRPGTRTDRAPEQDAPLEQLTSIAQLGDSVASGEGTLYGYVWDRAGQDWTGGDIDANWPEPFPDCHTSPKAYGTIVANYFRADLHQFACTGATFANGITTPRTVGSTEDRPAEFGNWADKTDLNANYDEAEAQLVIVTLGADDLQFSAIVEHCIKNGYEYYWGLADLECTDANPGTNYANPLPPDGTVCDDTNYMYAQQIKYLSGLVDQLNGIVEDTIAALDDPDVAVADISQAYTVQGTSHIWCSADPWAYGLSIYSVTSPRSLESQAPFHPTPDGQESIAEHVIPVVRRWFAPPGDAPAESTTPTTPTDEPAPSTTG